MRSNLNSLEDKIDHHFTQGHLLDMALKHPSLDLGTGDNQRLEFLGDAVLDLLIAEHLYQHYPEQQEGQLDQYRASLVSGKSLAKKALELNLDQHLCVSEAQRTHHPQPSKAMLEDALEAIIGAIYLDAGLDAARHSVTQIFAHELTHLTAAEPFSNRAKSRLQEWTQKHRAAQPDYHLKRTEGPDHAREYFVDVALQGEVIGSGAGSSKKAAESAAAAAALQHLEDR